MKPSEIFFLLAMLCLVIAASDVHWALSLIVVSLYLFACSAVNESKENKPK